MKDKEIRKELILLHGELYALKNAVALLVAESNHINDELLMKKFEAVQKRMQDDFEVYSTSLLNGLEAQDLADNDE